MKNTLARSQSTKDSDIKVLFNKILKNIHYLIGSVVICLILAFFYNRTVDTEVPDQLAINCKRE